MGQSRRLPYFHGGGERPLLRGSVMANLLLVWPVAVAVHFGAVALFEPRPGRAAIRLLVGIATTLNVFFSDRYHNSDLRYPDGSASQRTEREVAWLRCDFVGISLVLSTTFLLWTSHFGWPASLATLTWLTGAATAAVAAAAFGLYGRGDGAIRTAEAIIKATLGVQYVFFFGYMVLLALRTPCAPNTAIWFTYMPGFLSYALKWPADGPAWGSHDVFHVFVLLGHAMSALCDAVNVHADCIVQ